MRTVWGRNRRGDESGQTSLMMVAAVAVLLVIVTVMITNLGRGLDREGETRTAADASALAAAEAYRTVVDNSIRSVVSPLDLQGLLLRPASSFTTTASGDATRLAAQNNSQLTSLSIQPRLGAHRFTATTQNRQVLENSSRRATFSATAEARIKSGPVCVLVDGKVGLWLRGSCVRGERIILVIPPAVAPEVTPPGHHLFEGASLTELMTRIRANDPQWGVRLVE